MIKLRLTKTLPWRMGNTGRNLTRTLPWAVKLATDKQCELMSGATATIAGMRVNYACGDGGYAIGAPQRSSTTWTIFYAPSLDAGSFEPAAISEAWW